MLKRNYNFRLKPTAAQNRLMASTLELCRWTYNETLGLRKKAWEEEKKTLSGYDTMRFLPKWKREKPELKEAHSQVLTNVHERVDLAFRAFFRRAKNGENPGYPRFKGEGWYKSFTYPQSGFSLQGNVLHLSKIGDVAVVLHRQLPQASTVKRLTIKREVDKWYAIFSVQQPESGTARCCGKGIVGIDLGCTSFVTLSNGKKVKNPKFAKKAEKRLKKAHRKISRAEKASAQRRKARKVLQKVSQKVSNQRNDFLHKTSRKLVSTYETLVFEDLKVQDMIEAKPWRALNRSIMDSSWDRFVNMCSYKAESAGGRVITVNPRNTTKMCSRCGALVEKDLSERIHSCPLCGLKMDRDLNAAINILRLGHQSLVLRT